MYKLISILAFLLFLSQINSFAINNNTEFDLEDEEYVNDIPFNTSTIIGIDLDTNKNEDFMEPGLEFIQNLIIVRSIMAVNFDMEEEEYVDDIPFDTESVADKNVAFLSAAFIQGMSVEFTLEDEGYIDDIPFDTSAVVSSLRP